MQKKSQSSYSEYYQGTMPTYRPGGGVDFSQLSSSFSRTSDVMNLVYQYAPDISREVSYIFDFSNQGAYGVYIPALVEEVKTNELKKQLEQRNYEVKEENGMMVAYPKDGSEEDNEKIKDEIKQLWDRINAGKSEVLGVNMNKVKSSTEENMKQLIAAAENAGVPISNPQLLWDMLTMLELGATIIHEWEHSRGGDEGASEGRERDFVNSTMPIIKQKYKDESGEEMPVGNSTLAKNKSWYRFAQYMNYIPSHIRNKPTGSDLSGRGGKIPTGDGNLADWGMMMQQNQKEPIENRLGRGFVWPLAKGLVQEHQTIEEQLRRQTAGDCVPDASLIYEELLAKDRDSTQGYKTLEQLMEERRPQPIMVPLEKTASKIKKEATLFGWYNNLDISDGSTLQGMGDRVMKWDDRDESFSAEESEIREQPRYNPSYDLKGFYYRWIEPRFKPQLWDDMTQDLSNTHPAKRFAQIDSESDMPKMLNILETIKDRILSGKMKASRLIITSDIYQFVRKTVGCEGVNIKAFKFGKTEQNESIYAVWIVDPSVDSGTLKKAEGKFQMSAAPDALADLVEDLLGFSSYRVNVVEEIVNAAALISKKYGIDDLCVIGTYARERAYGNDKPDVEELDFSTESPFKNAKVGQLLADTLGITPEINTKLTFAYKGVKVEFSLVNKKEEIARLSLLKVKNNNQIMIDLLNRDFTINMFVYNVSSKEILDPFKVAKGAMRNKTVETLLKSEAIIKNNPILILRALKLVLKYKMKIDADLERTMISYGGRLFKGQYTDFELLFARESIKDEGKYEADKLFDAFGLWKIKKIE